MCHCCEPSGSQTARKIAFCSWTCWKVRGQRRGSGYGGRTGPTRETQVLTLCFGHFEQCYLRQCEALGQSIILLLDQLRWLFILDLLIAAGVKRILREPPHSLTVWTLSLGICHGCIFFKTVSYSRLSVLLPVRRERNPWAAMEAFGIFRIAKELCWHDRYFSHRYFRLSHGGK